MTVTFFKANFGPWELGPQHGFARIQWWKAKEPIMVIYLYELIFYFCGRNYFIIYCLKDTPIFPSFL